MEHGLELLHENLLDGLHVLEGEGRVPHQPVGYLPVYNLVHQRADALLRMLLQAARGGLHGVRHHQHGGLLREGVRPGVGEGLLVDGPVGVLVLERVVEVLRLAPPVVRADEVDDRLGQHRLLGYLHALGYVADDDTRALVVRELAVRVHAGLVLGEEGGVRHLADVVVKRAGPDELGVRPNLVSRLRREDGYLQRVLEGARAGLAEPFQYGVVDVGQLHQRDGGDVAEGLLQHVDQHVGEHQQDEVDAEVEHHHPVYLVEVRLLEQHEAQVIDHVGEEDEEGATNQLRAFAQVLQAEGDHHAGHDLQEQELVGEGHHQRAYQRDDEVDEQRRARVEEGTYHDGHDGEREDVDVEQRVVDAQLREDAAHEDAQQQEPYVLPVVEYLHAERPEVEPEAEHQPEDEHELPREDDALRLRASAFRLVDVLQRAEHVVGMVVHDLAPVHDALAGLHHPVGERYALQDVLFHLLRHLGGVGDVLGDVVVDVAGLQRRLVEVRGAVVDDGLVGGPHGEEVAHVMRPRDGVLQQVDLLLLRVPQLLQRLRRDDAGLV